MEIKEIKEWLKDNGFCIDIDKEMESMRRLGCSYFRMCLNGAALTIDLRKE